MRFECQSTCSISFCFVDNFTSSGNRAIGEGTDLSQVQRVPMPEGPTRVRREGRPEILDLKGTIDVRSASLPGA